jgi:hypothetical protein
MKGSEFAQTFGPKGLAAWEAAALQLASQGGILRPSLTEITLTTPEVKAKAWVTDDVISVGQPDDFLRLPLTPTTAQQIADVLGMQLLTPWMVFQRWRAAPVKLIPTPISPNKGASMAQFVLHNQLIEQARQGRSGIVEGAKKSVVVGNLYRPGKVLIFGWYRPAPDVFDDKQPMTATNRQPRQPYSNVHGDFYLDYSHGFPLMLPEMEVEGKTMLTEDVMKHPELWKLVSHEGPLRMTRYPTPQKPERPSAYASRSHGFEELGILHVVERKL